MLRQPTTGPRPRKAAERSIPPPRPIDGARNDGSARASRTTRESPQRSAHRQRIKAILTAARP